MDAETPYSAPYSAARAAILEAALAHVPFDGWSDATLRAAMADSGVAPGLASAIFPRGALDLALAYHRRGDAAMVATLQAADLAQMRFRDRIAFAVMARLDLVEDKELVRRGTTFFAMPQNAAEGAKAIWGTADAIWTALGDTSDDLNWYTKRSTLSAVYSATVLYWLGDSSEGQRDTRDFLDRRIGNVMDFEKFKASPLGKTLLSPLKLFSGLRAPQSRKACHPDHLPGSLKDPT
ncbi:COQ9 family protein [Gemmobacter serpentinus]|uniref:COQ9 family protein n=1 Tax=Gemmobacter serpentinus TaxID=2652247 RepID=UPI00124D05E1|nr:COQ9 family protein [Gemmobacter serpentinus]